MKSFFMYKVQQIKDKWVVIDDAGEIASGEGKYPDFVKMFVIRLNDAVIKISMLEKLNKKLEHEITQLKDDLSKASFISENSKFYKTYEDWLKNNRGENDWIEVHLGLKVGDKVIAISDIANKSDALGDTFCGEKGVIEKIQNGNVVVKFDCGQTIEYDPHGFEKDH